MYGEKVKKKKRGANREWESTRQTATKYQWFVSNNKKFLNS